MSRPTSRRRGLVPAPEPVRRRLSLDAVVDAALEVLGREGLESFTIRAVAAELGTGGASLYAYVEGKDALIEAVIERTIGNLEIPDPPDPERWQEQLKTTVRRMHDTYALHPAVAQASLGRIPLGPNALRVMEGMVGILRAGNLPDLACAYALDDIALFAAANAYESSLFLDAGGALETHEELEREVTAHFEALEAAHFPHLASMATVIASGTGEERFEFKLDVLVRGLATLAET